MKTGTALAATLFVLTSFSLLAQQPEPGSEPATPPRPQTTAPGSQPEQQAPGQQPGSAAEPAAASEAATTAAVEMRPVQAELMSTLDTQTAKNGDNIVAQTKNSVKTADGTEIPKGTKLMGHVVAVQASTGGTNSQVALQFDQAQLKDGKTLPIHSEIQSIEPKGGAAASGDPGAMDRGPVGASAGATNPGSAATGPGASGGGANSGSGAAGAGANPGYARDPGTGGMGNSSPAEGTVVGKTGNINIKTTAVPGVLLANNAPGQQDPRMAQASGILLGAKKDVKLEGGTQMTLAVATMPGGPAQ